MAVGRGYDITGYVTASESYTVGETFVRLARASYGEPCGRWVPPVSSGQEALILGVSLSVSLPSHGRASSCQRSGSLVASVRARGALVTRGSVGPGLGALAGAALTVAPPAAQQAHVGHAGVDFPEVAAVAHALAAHAVAAPAADGRLRSSGAFGPAAAVLLRGVVVALRTLAVRPQATRVAQANAALSHSKLTVTERESLKPTGLMMKVFFFCLGQPRALASTLKETCMTGGGFSLAPILYRNLNASDADAERGALTMVVDMLYMFSESRWHRPSLGRTMPARRPSRATWVFASEVKMRRWDAPGRQPISS
ncbi:hypothetical protein EYF80_022040 [Liparis tanakae]|uniref:Uncharacterized protein n=1 Tax=Liparis tanakae TaxID=230148 RepID=A0A4Z2HRU3_9TELE|nr:hypothetical protein EYF80_022040 [Liparis tanakae]